MALGARTLVARVADGQSKAGGENSPGPPPSFFMRDRTRRCTYHPRNHFGPQRGPGAHSATAPKPSVAPNAPAHGAKAKAAEPPPGV